MHLCFIDESGLPDQRKENHPFCLVGVCIPFSLWSYYERRLQLIKEEFDLPKTEIHCSHMLRDYEEQNGILEFDQLDFNQRRARCGQKRKAISERAPDHEQDDLERQRKQQAPYWHLSKAQRWQLLSKFAEEFSRWNRAVWFAHCIDKPASTGDRDRSHAALVPLLLDLHTELLRVEPLPDESKPLPPGAQPTNCMLVHDCVSNSERKQFAASFTKGFDRLEPNLLCFGPTPLFVDSRDSNLLQLADLCATSVRQYTLRGDETLLRLIASSLRSLPQHLNCDCLLCNPGSDHP
jgi:hypothetical protein